MKEFLEKLVLSSLFAIILLSPEKSFAWGNGHDHVNRLALTILPAEILDQLPEKMKKNVVRMSHVPDDFTLWEKWNKNLVRRLKTSQLDDGSIRGSQGTYVSTTLSLLAIAVNYRFLPIYER